VLNAARAARLGQSGVKEAMADVATAVVAVRSAGYVGRNRSPNRIADVYSSFPKMDLSCTRKRD
jgi:hypothetical protein